MPSSPRDAVRPLLRTRQVREFTGAPLPDDVLDSITDVARWTGSSKNTQPWRFIVVRDRQIIRRLHEAGLPQTRSLATAPALVAVAVPEDREGAASHAFDEGRAVERMLVAASLLGIAAGVAWVMRDAIPVAREALALPDGWRVRSLVVLGYPTEAATAPKSPRGRARLPRESVIFEERWPAD